MSIADKVSGIESKEEVKRKIFRGETNSFPEFITDSCVFEQKQRVFRLIGISNGRGGNFCVQYKCLECGDINSILMKGDFRDYSFEGGYVSDLRK